MRSLKKWRYRSTSSADTTGVRGISTTKREAPLTGSASTVSVSPVIWRAMSFRLPGGTDDETDGADFKREPRSRAVRRSTLRSSTAGRRGEFATPGSERRNRQRSSHAGRILWAPVAKGGNGRPGALGSRHGQEAPRSGHQVRRRPVLPGWPVESPRRLLPRCQKFILLLKVGIRFTSPVVPATTLGAASVISRIASATSFD